MKNKISVIIILLAIGLSFCSNNEEQYVILVSFDGFRYDYTDRVKTPNFDYLKKWGIKAKSLKPIFPSFTFPNHYAIATGCYADKHGILGNVFKTNLGTYSYRDKNTVRDAKWYGAEPIWVTAEKNGIITATYFWVGSEAPILGYYPTYYKNYENGIDPKKKVDQAIDWLTLPIDERPRLVCLYFNEPDHAGHVFGENSIEVNKEIENSDNVLGYLLRSITELDIYKKINIVIVSDHGMVNVSNKRMINVDDFNISAIIDGNGPIMSIMTKDTIFDSTALFNIPNTTALSMSEANYLHYDNPLYDFLLVADSGWMMYTSDDFKKYNGELPVKGMHGYNSSDINMHAIFYAYGPLFKKNIEIDTFELIHIYPLLCKMLNIDPYENTDGRLEILEPILR